MTWYSLGSSSELRLASSATTTNCSIAPNSSWIAAIERLYGDVGHRIGDSDDGSPTLRPVQKNAHSAITAIVPANVTMRPVGSSIALQLHYNIRFNNPLSRRAITTLSRRRRY